MKRVVFKLIDRLGNGKTYQVDLFEEEFFEDPAYRTIEDLSMLLQFTLHLLIKVKSLK